MEKRNQLLFTKLVLLIIFIGFIIWLTISYYNRIVEIISSPDKFRHLLISYHSLSILIFIFFQIIVVILAPLPGELLLIAGGYIYGTILGAIYSLVGILLGSIIVFGISKFFGSAIIEFLIGPRRFNRLCSLVNHQKSDLAIFFLYLIPEIPKDILTYIAGLTPIDPLKFIIFSTIARIPCVIGSSYIGANLQQKNYLPVIILLILVGLLLIVVFLTRKQLAGKLNRLLSSKNSDNRS